MESRSTENVECVALFVDSEENAASERRHSRPQRVVKGDCVEELLRERGALRAVWWNRDARSRSAADRIRAGMVKRL